MKIIFDLDLTLIGSKIADPYRPSNWSKAFGLIPEFTEYSGMKDVLRYLKDHEIEYCIVTSSPAKYCNKVCGHWGFCTDHTVTYWDVTKRKPHPEPILLALKKLNAEAEQVLSFGDRDIDIQSSNAAGVRSVACLWGAEDTRSLLAASPKHVISTPSEIIPLLHM
ncbi:MAG: HAD family hydrolase [Sediminibacterium sp.]